MARTHRRVPNWKCHRRPRHLNEEGQLRQLITDAWVEGYKVSGLNRTHKRLASLPDAWDDLMVSSLYESRQGHQG